MTHRSFAILLAFAPLNSATLELTDVDALPLQLVGPATGLTIGGLVGCMMVEITKLMATPMTFLTRSTFAGAGMVAGQIAQDKIANLDSHQTKYSDLQAEIDQMTKNKVTALHKQALLDQAVLVRDQKAMTADAEKLQKLQIESNVIVRKARETLNTRESHLADMPNREDLHDKQQAWRISAANDTYFHDLDKQKWLNTHTDKQIDLLQRWEMTYMNQTHDFTMKNINSTANHTFEMNEAFRYWVGKRDTAQWNTQLNKIEWRETDGAIHFKKMAVLSQELLASLIKREQNKQIAAVEALKEIARLELNETGDEERT